MAEDKEQFVTTLLFPNEYMRQLNQVSGLTSQKIVYLKRKLVSKSGFELVNYPMTECNRISYYDERPVMTMVFGLILVSLIALAGYGLYLEWGSLPPQTRIPVGALLLGSLYGFRAILRARRHRLVFSLRDGSKLTWKSRSGDYKHKQPNAAKVVEFAKSIGILAVE
jgi:hypothetical protein